MRLPFFISEFNISQINVRPNKLTLMVLVGARTTFPSRTNFFFISKKKNSKKKGFIYIKNPVRVSLVVEFLVLKTL